MIHIDEQAGEVRVDDGTDVRTYPIGSPEAFQVISRAWLRSGWDTKYVYGFSWLGRPIIQLPEDMVRIQELIHAVQPTVIVETGVAHGGSLVYYASLCKAMDRGRVVGVDVEIRPHNRSAIESHQLFPLITLIEGDSVSDQTLEEVRTHVSDDDVVLVILDSNHTRAHVLAELEAYSPLVTSGSYIVATDGIMRDLAGAPRSAPDWTENNPAAAVRDFLATRSDFELAPLAPPFNEGSITEPVTDWPDAYLRRVR